MTTAERCVCGLEHCTDLGNNVHMLFTENAEGVTTGLLESHLRPDGAGWCFGGVTFAGHGRGNQPTWDVQSMDPLTITPSLLCRICGHHGFIQNGRWVSA